MRFSPAALLLALAPIAAVAQTAGPFAPNATLYSTTAGAIAHNAPAGTVGLDDFLSTKRDAAPAIAAETAAAAAAAAAQTTASAALAATAAALVSPAFSGVPTTPTASPGTSTTQIASTAFVTGAVTAATTGVASFNTRTGAVTLNSGDVTTALTFTPYNASNPSNYIAASGAPVQSVAGLTGAPTVAQIAAAMSGTTSTTLAAGNDSRITSACQTTGCVMTGALTPSTTSGIVGTTTANNANAGSDGEYLSTTGSSTTMTTSTYTNLATLTLPAGDWDVAGSVQLQCTGNSITIAAGGVTTTPATQPAFGQLWQLNFAPSEGDADYVLNPIPTTRFNVASSTLVYVVGYQTCASGTLTGLAFIRARRVR